MSATLAPPAPVAAPPPSRGGAPARRAIRRWAWRLLRREWRQQSLILSLLIVAVAATTVGLGLVTHTQLGDQGVFGAASARMEIGGPGPTGPADALAAARQAFGSAELIVHQTVPVPGSITPVDLRAQDPQGRFSRPTLRLVSGRFPSAGEAAVTKGVATTFDLRIGSTWTVSRRPLQVVGIVENPNDLLDAFGLVAPGQLAAPTGMTLLFNATDQQALRFRLPPGSGDIRGVMISGDNVAKQRRIQALAVLLLSTIGLIFIGLLAVAGFTVLAQRRMRALGMIGAIGGTDRQVRRVMLSNGAAVGVVGAGLGVVLGIGLWLALTPAFERLVGHRYDPFTLPWWGVVTGALLAIAAAIAASWWPARSAARRPIVDALAARPAPPQPAHRFALLGSALAGGGFVALLVADGKRNLLIVTGILALTLGMLLLAPVGIRVLAAIAVRTPVAVRLALRDLARYQARSGAALAAASLAVALAATISVTAAAEQAHDHTLSEGNLPRDQLVVWLVNTEDRGGPGPGLKVRPVDGPLGAANLPSSAAVAKANLTAAAISQAIGGRNVLELDRAIVANAQVPTGAPPDAVQAALVRPVTETGRGRGWKDVVTPFVATPAVLSFYGIRTADLAGSDVLTSRRDLDGVQLGARFMRSFAPVAVRTSARLPRFSSAPSVVLTPAAMAAHGYTAEPVGWLVQAKHPLTATQLRDARSRAAAVGLTIESRTSPDRSLQRLRQYATLIGVLVALGILAMTIGLIRSETAGDLRTLSAVGAGGGTRRRLNAATAAALGLLGAILGTATAYLGMIAWHWRDIAYLSKPPYAELVVLVLGLPAAAAVGAWLLGRPPSSLGRRALD